MRLIDADVMWDRYNNELCCEYDMADAYNLLKRCIDEAPTINAKPMVHCGDCIGYEPNSKVCTKFEHDELFDKDCGCNHGKPRDGE